MSTLFGGGMNRDITDIVTRLSEGGLVNENAGQSVNNIDIDNMADSLRKIMYENYSGKVASAFDTMLKEDAESCVQMFKNNIVEAQTMSSPAGTMNESALMPTLVTLTASIATTMRTPYEAVLHRLFDTRTLEKQMVDIEEVIPTIRAPGDARDEDLIDALAPYAKVPFVKRTEIMVTELTDGVPMDTKNLKVLQGQDPRFRVNRDLRIVGIDAEYEGTPIDKKDISFAKGTTPFFQARDNEAHCLFNVKLPDGTIYPADVDAKFDFDGNVLLHVRGDKIITKVYFYATVSHHEHTHPIHTSFRNNFEQYIVPTRPHIEVSLPQEMRTDIANSIQHFANTDVVTAMTENITVISSRMEDQRLYECLQQGAELEAGFPFEAPQNFAYGNLEWLKREFIPFLDQIALKLKNYWNITDCHFRVGVSPYILRILDTDYTMDKSLTEESKGAGAINYSIGVKTSTSVFYFISSQMFEDNYLKICLIPNQWKMAQVRTFNYFKYSSFLTDQLRRADSPVQPAIVYSERNLPIVFRNISADVTISDMPTTKSSGARYIRKATPKGA